MNILPKKRWHVRTRENIARVRRDEKQAAEEEKERLRKIALAEQEARIDLLRRKAKKFLPEGAAKQEEEEGTSSRWEIEEKLKSGEHVNFFSEVESGKYQAEGENKEYVKEKKDEKEKYEKQVGYLTYLGQDTNEALGKRSWYEEPPKREDRFTESGKIVETGLKSKIYNDPLNVMKRYLAAGSSRTSTSSSTPDPSLLKAYESLLHSQRERSSEGRSKKHKEKKRKRSRRSSSESEDETERSAKKAKLEKLRAERLQREKAERQRTDAFLAKLRGDPEPEKEPKKTEKEPPVRPMKQKYNSQFNPELAKQNYDWRR
ncbi:leukocyte receptor cluster member 1 homolog [Lutzomyia longipalpis]|uniref:leukocyte receptor cluster member 1 homolog n=1 Tax=Lutzomyia longipalpis TaxID=7200 RepID=UPI0024833A0B|nr:leukocyte receptor cluster member 1 homolog [Lutzomyia longipalpis]